MTTTTSGARTRLSPEERREQLLELGVRLFAGGSIEDISIERLSEEGGVSRGLLYHYFGSKQGFHEAVVQRCVDDLIAQTAPPDVGDPIERLLVSMTAYVDYVVANHEGYRSLVRAAAGGNEELRRIYEDARAAMIDRTFASAGINEILADNPATRLVVRGWSAFVEDTVLAWCADPRGVSRGEVVRVVTDALPSLVATLHRAHAEVPPAQEGTP